MKKNYGFVPKAEFSRRLNFLQSRIIYVLGKPLSSPKSELMPALYGVYSYMWCKRQEDLYNKIVLSEVDKEFSDFLDKFKNIHPLPKDSVLLPTVVSEPYDPFKAFKSKFDVLCQSHDFGITSEYENGFCAALSEVYKLLKDCELPF